MSLPLQQYFDFGPHDHFQLLHGQHHADVALAHKAQQWQEHVYEHKAAASMTVAMADWQDTYIGQNGFLQRRTVLNVAVLTACWVDLDTYNVPELAGTDADELLGKVLQVLPWLPVPTMVINSGRGVYFEWKFRKNLSSEFLPRWQAVIGVLTELLAPWGADAHSKDAARVLRIVGSVNGRSGEIVNGHQTGPVIEFSKLESIVLGEGRAQVQRAAAPKPLRLTPAERPEAFELQPPASRRVSPATAAQKAQYVRPFQLAYDRMHDCITIARLRGSPRMADYRHRLLYVYAVAGAWYWSDLEQAQDELHAFSCAHFDQADNYSIRRVSTVLEHMRQAKMGIPGIWKGHKVDRRYQMRNDTIIRVLQLTPDEQRELRTIISPEERNRRRQERRRAAGKAPRSEYLGQAQERRQKAVELRQHGMSQMVIAQVLGVSQAHVSMILSGKR